MTPLRVSSLARAALPSYPAPPPRECLSPSNPGPARERHPPPPPPLTRPLTPPPLDLPPRNFLEPQPPSSSSATLNPP
eukprot:2963002-Pyramimonas_sp.AAC.1